MTFKLTSKATEKSDLQVCKDLEKEVHLSDWHCVVIGDKAM